MTNHTRREIRAWLRAVPVLVAIVATAAALVLTGLGTVR